MPRILICGTYHLGQTNDLYTYDEEKTIELLVEESKEIIKKLQVFKPKAIAVEREYKYQKELTLNYNAFLEDNIFQMNEISILGFHLASKLNHKNIFAIDDMTTREDNPGMGGALQYAKEKQPELYKKIMDILEKQSSKFPETDNFLQKLIHINQTENIFDQRVNILTSKIGVNDNQIGIRWLEWWLKRNAIITSRVSDLADEHEDVLLLIGSSHVDLVVKFLKDMNYEVVFGNKYLV